MSTGWARIRNIAQAYVLSMIVWMALALITGWQDRNLAWAERRDTSLTHAVLLPAIRYLIYALLTPPLFFVVRRYPIRLDNPLRRGVAYVGGVAPFVVVYVMVRWLVIPPYSVITHQFAKRTFGMLIGLIRGSVAEQVGVYFALLFAAHAYEYFNRARNQELERYELQQALATSELAALKAQLHPHFLFNTLHNISTLIDTDRRSAKEMILKLSSLLRLTLQYGSSDLVPLEEELRFIRAYLDLEKMRLGSRLSVEWRLEQNAMDVLIPQMFLQPLVENAILHGIACSREGGQLRIAARTCGDSIEIEITNTVGGRQQPGMGVGLKNTVARLRHIYSGDAHFIFALNEDGTATARATLPALGSRGILRPRTSVELKEAEDAHTHC